MKEPQPKSKLQAARNRKMWTMEELAEQVGVDVQTIYRWESGLQRPRAYALRKLLAVFGVSAEELGLGSVSGQRSPSPLSGETVLEERTPGALAHQGMPLSAQSASVLRLTPEQAVVLLPLLKEGESMAYDPRKRQTLKHLAYAIEGFLAVSAAPAALLDGLSLLPGSSAKAIDETTIDHFHTMVTLCWRLLKGNELLAVAYLLPTFLPELEVLAQSPSRQQHVLAESAAQGNILAGLSATLQLDHVASEAYCKKAIAWSRVAGDRTLEAAALKHLAVKYFDLKYPRKTLQTYQEVLPFIEAVSPLMQSRTYLGLAAAYAQMNQEQDALRYLGMAQESFPLLPEDDPSFAYADCGPSSLNHYGGLIYLDLGQPQKAWETFAGIEALKHQIVIPERTILEIENCQAEAAVAQRDLELASSHIQSGVAGAQRLNSERRFADVFAVYKEMRLVWPHEPQVKALADLFQR